MVKLVMLCPHREKEGSCGMRKLIIKKSSLKNNVQVIKERSGSAAIYAVLSGNGFGAGTVEMARLLREEGILRC